MVRVTAFIFGTLISISVLGQEQNNVKIRIRDGNIDEHVFYLLTTEGNIELDSIELQNINPNWIKSVNVVQLIEESAKGTAKISSPSVANIYIELKRRYLKKYLGERAEKNNDI